MRGYFAVGVEGISKSYNVGNLVRTAHSFGASHFYTIGSELKLSDMRQSDTSGAFDHMPYYEYDTFEDMDMPLDSSLVGIELVEDSIEMPSFRHPTRAIYMMGPEMGSLSPKVQDACDHIVHIPMKFCVNVGVAGAIMMYDRMLSMGRFAERPVKAGGPLEPLLKQQRGHRRKSRR